AAALLSAGAVGNDRRDGADLSRACAAGYFRQRRGAMDRGWNLGADVHRLPADVAVLPVVALMGFRAACYCLAVHALHPRFGPSIGARTGRKLEGAGAGQRVGAAMITPAEARSGKGHRDENFPVASRLIHPRNRGPILAFYEFVRTADDIADHSALAPQEKLALIDRLEATLLGKSNDDPVGVALPSQPPAPPLPSPPPPPFPPPF